MFSTTIDVPNESLEQNYKHMNHADALKLLEEARLRYMTEIGYPQSEMLAKDFFAVIVQMNARYKREIFEGPYQVTCEEPNVGRKLFVIRQRIINSEGEDCIDAEVKFLFMSGKSRKSVSPPPEFIEDFLKGLE